MSLRALLERDDIPADAQAVIREALATTVASATAEHAFLRQRELATDLVGADSVDAALNLCLGAALDLSGFEAGGVYLVDPCTGDLQLMCHVGLSAAFAAMAERLSGDSPQARRVREGRSLYWSAAEPGGLPGALERAEGLAALVGLPVHIRGEVRAWINLASRTVAHPPADTMDSLEVVGSLLGVALHRLQTETALRRSEERYRALVESAPDAIFAVDAAGTILAVNPAAARLLSRDAGDVTGRSLRDIFPPAEAERRIGLMRRIHETGQGATATYQEPYPGLGPRWFNAILSPVFGADGGVTCVLGIARDITEQVEAQQALRDSEERYRTLVEAAPDLTMTFDREGVFLSANRAAVARLGRTLEELIGRSLFDVMPEAAAQRRLDLIRRVFETGETVTARDPSAMPGGEGVTFETVCAPVHGADGRIAHCLVIARDITERLQATAALERSERRYVMATAAGKVAVWDWDVVHREMYDVAGLMAMLGYGPDEMDEVPKQWEQLRHPDDREAARAINRRLYAGEADEFSLEQRLLHRDGTYRWVLTRGEVFRDEAGRVVRMVGTNTDITEHKQAEQERQRIAARLQQAERLESLGVLAGGAAHDFSNLLTGLLGNLSLARRRLDPASPVRPYLLHAESAASQAAELAENMLAYSGRDPIERSPLDPHDLLRDAITLALPALPEKVGLVANVPPELPAVLGGAAHLRAVLGNLIGNAGEAIGGRRGTVTVDAEVVEADAARLAQTYVDDGLPAGRYLSVRVTDDGPGMDAETLSRVFDPFFTTKPQGRGLGLAYALGVIRAHRGAIEVRSRRGKGSVFEVLLPLAAEARLADGTEAPLTEPAAEPGRGTLLLAEDEALVRAVAAAALEEAGFTVLQASDGTEALRLFHERGAEVRAVLLDLAMPGADGVRVVREVRGLRPDIPVVVASADGADIASRLPGTGPACFVRKPYRPEQLIAGVRDVLAE